MSMFKTIKESLNNILIKFQTFLILIWRFHDLFNNKKIKQKPHFINQMLWKTKVYGIMIRGRIINTIQVHLMTLWTNEEHHREWKWSKRFQIMFRKASFSKTRFQEIIQSKDYSLINQENLRLNIWMKKNKIEIITRIMRTTRVTLSWKTILLQIEGRRWNCSTNNMKLRMKSRILLILSIRGFT